jgi:hypothetical protein
MRTIRCSNRFRCDYKREKAGRHSKTLDNELTEIVRLLAADTPYTCWLFENSDSTIINSPELGSRFAANIISGAFRSIKS